MRNFFLTFFYAGYIPFAPGTFATLLILLLMLLIKEYIYLHILIFFIFSLFSMIFLRSEKERKEIVVDEVCGYLLATLGIKKNFFSLFSSFILFRVFDILKPGPIKRLHERGGLSILYDDLLCGLFANICSQILGCR